MAHRETGKKKLRHKISRRTFMEGALAASAAGAAAWGVHAAGSIVRPHVDRESTALRTAQILPRVLNRIIPPSATMPGAGDIGLAAYFADIAAEARHVHAHVDSVLGRIVNEPGAIHGSDADLDRLLASVEREARPSFDVFVRVTYVGYYSDPLVRAACGWEHTHVSDADDAAFDIDLLKRVRNRGYRL